MENSAAGPGWNDAPDFGRRTTIMRTLRHLYSLHPGPVCIVETGTLRDARDHAREAQGWSTLAFAWYCQQVGGRLTTVDLSIQALDICRAMTHAYENCIEYVNADSVQFLASWSAAQRQPINLLYLDSLDYFENIRQYSEMHQLAEAHAALPHLASDALILLDDTYTSASKSVDYEGKGARSVPYLMARGYAVVWCFSGQLLLARATTTRPPGG